MDARVPPPGVHPLRSSGRCPTGDRAWPTSTSTRTPTTRTPCSRGRRSEAGTTSRPTSRTPSTSSASRRPSGSSSGGSGLRYDSGTVYHKIRDDLSAKGVVFTDTDTAVKEYPEIVRKYFGKIVPYNDNKFSALNSAVWSGGQLRLHPAGRRRRDPAAGLLPNQCEERRPVRADAHHRRQGGQGPLHRRMPSHRGGGPRRRQADPH